VGVNVGVTSAFVVLVGSTDGVGVVVAGSDCVVVGDGCAGSDGAGDGVTELGVEFVLSDDPDGAGDGDTDVLSAAGADVGAGVVVSSARTKGVKLNSTNCNISNKDKSFLVKWFIFIKISNF
jgi:hypothetical protein